MEIRRPHANGSETGPTECGTKKIASVGHPDAFKNLNSCEKIRTVPIRQFQRKLSVAMVLINKPELLTFNKINNDFITITCDVIFYFNDFLTFIRAVNTIKLKVDIELLTTISHFLADLTCQRPQQLSSRSITLIREIIQN